jgi:uncharacterized protein
MTLEEKVKAVEEVFQKLDAEIASFQSATGLHCTYGCGKCCFKPDIEATSLEFLPFAFHLYQQQQAERWLERLRHTDSPVCLILDEARQGAGLCTQYAHRGLICRLFGYSARTNKYGAKELVTCQIIKTEQSGHYAKAQAGISQGLPVPVMHHYYLQLNAIDFNLAQDFYPINKAIERAIETVLHYYAYR